VTVDEIVDILDEFQGNTQVIIEIAGVGVDDRSTIRTIQKAIYHQEEVHLIGEPVND
jgi:hypothetical protein